MAEPAPERPPVRLDVECRARRPEALDVVADDIAQTPASFEDFYLEATPDLVRLATLIVGSRSVAEDLVQDAFVRVHRRRNTIDEPAPYVRRAVVNACRSHLRRRRLERRHRSSLSVAVAELEARELLDALAELPVRQRAAIVLRFYDGLSERETAAVLGCAPGTVGSLVHRALASLRQAIEK